MENKRIIDAVNSGLTSHAFLRLSLNEMRSLGCVSVSASMLRVNKDVDSNIGVLTKSNPYFSAHLLAVAMTFDIVCFLIY